MRERQEVETVNGKGLYSVFLRQWKKSRVNSGVPPPRGRVYGISMGAGTDDPPATVTCERSGAYECPYRDATHGRTVSRSREKKNSVQGQNGVIWSTFHGEIFYSFTIPR